MKAIKKQLFFLVFILMALCAIFCMETGSSSKTAAAAETTTPRYQLNLNWVYKSGPTSIPPEKKPITGSGTSTTPKVPGTNDKYFTIYLMGRGGSTAQTKTINSPAYLNFSDISFVFSSTLERAKLTITNSSGGTIVSKFINDFSNNTYSTNYAEGNYHLHTNQTFYFTGNGNNLYYLDFDFAVDLTAPTVSVSCGDNGFSNDSVTVDYSDNLMIDSAAYTRSTGANFSVTASNPFNSGTTFTDEGNYTVVVTDKAGNTTTKYFTIDKTAPKLTLSGVTDQFANGDVSANWTNSVSGAGYQRVNSNDTLRVNYNFSKKGVPFPGSAITDYTAGTVLTEEGCYQIRIIDSAGNVTHYLFYIDKTAPKLTLSGVTDGGFTNGEVSASWETTVDFNKVGSQRINSSDTLTVMYSRSTTSTFPTGATTYYTAGTKLTQEGNYRIRIKDRAGNYNDYTFTIDKTAPKLTLSGVTDGGFTNGKVSASWSTTEGGVGAQRMNNNDVLYSYFSRSTTSTFPKSASAPYSTGTTIADEGNYLIMITDSAGNTSKYTFTIDKTAPKLTLSGVTDGGFTNRNVSASWETTVGNVGAQRVNSNDELTVKYSFNTDANFPSSSKIDYTADSALSAEGNYRITINDSAGNSSFLVFTIDKTAPTIKITTSDNSDFINNRTAKDVYVSWTSTISGKGSQRVNSNDTLTVKYSHSTSSMFPTSATTDYSSGTKLTQEGKYLITITDAAGNSGIKQFEIYRQPPSFIVLSASGEELSKTPLAYNKDIKLVFNDCTAKLDNANYISGELINDEGEYSFILTDALGNRTSETIYIIKHLPTANLDRLITPINMWYETTDTNNNVYAFASKDNAMAVADERERALIAGGVWTSINWDGGVTIANEDLSIAKQGMAYYVYKSYASANTLNAYFSISTLNKSVEKYAAASINIKYTPSTPANAAEGEIVYRDTYYTKDAIRFNRIDNCTLYVDGAMQSYPFTLTSIGLHNIIETDIAGNSVAYSVVIDAAQPIVRVTNLNGNMPQALSYGTSHYFTYALRLYLDDIDEQALLKINDDYFLGGVIELRAAGTYTVSTRDAAGNSGNLTIYISLIEPTIDIRENEVADVVNSFTVQINKNYSLNNIDTLSILKYDDTESEWNPLTEDNSSSPVSISRNSLTYLFDLSGSYRIIVYDIFGRHLEKEYIFIKGSPKGTLSTTGGTILTSGDSTKSNFYFTWSNLLDCSAEISANGGTPIAYAKGTIIISEGDYSIKLYSNVDDVFNIYNVTIDKTAPEGTLIANGAELPNGTTTRYPVALSWIELGCTALLNGEPYTNGSVIAEEGDYTIELSDAAGNKRTFTFRIKTTPPKITLSTTLGKIANYDITKYDVYVSWTERNCTCLVNGQPYTINTKINIENSYTVILTDAYGNTNSGFFSIDKTAPVGQLLVDGVATPSKSIYTNKKVSFTWAELGCTAVINKDFIYSNGSIIAEDGSYTIKLSDAAGNITEYFFIIKTSKPNAKLQTNGQDVPSGARTKFEARLTWTESGCTATVNGEPYSKGALISAEGDYTFELFDSYGNTNSWQITIDKTAPVIVLTSNGDYLTTGQITRYDVCYNWDDTSATATLNGNAVEMGGVEGAEGEYTLIVTDDVGNKSSVVFIIDKTAKVGTLIANTTILDDGAITKYSAYFTWNGSSYTALINGEPYSKGALISAEGDYTIELIDRAENVSRTSFTIDKTAPEGTIYHTQDDTNFVLQSGAATNGNVFFDWVEEDCTALLNGQAYEKETLITAEGNYTIELTDRAGNVTKYSFKIDKTAPHATAHTINNDIIEDNAMTRYSIYFDWTESGCTATVNGEPYSKGAAITETGLYVFVLSDAVGNTVSLSIEVYKILPHAEITPVNNFILPYLNDGFSITWVEEDCTAFLNGQAYEKETLITAEGDYMFVLQNKVGLEFVENIIIDRTAPTILVFDDAGNAILDEVSLSYIYFDWTESGCTATVNGEPYKAKTYLTKDGSYTITLIDSAGNAAYSSIMVARKKPTLSLIKSSGNELSNGGSTTESVTIIPTSNAMTTITVNGDEYELGDELSKIGTYEVVITDVYGNMAEYTFTIKDISDKSSDSPFSKISEGSSVGTYILIALLGVLVLLVIIVPLIRTILKGSFKRKLK